MEGGVEGALLDAQQALRHGLDVEGDAEAVIGAAGERFEDQEIERSEERVGRSGHGFLPRRLTKTTRASMTQVATARDRLVLLS
jgi:hypothetical protein